MATTLSQHDLVLAYDMGGTKVLAGVVSRQGKVLEKVKEYVVKNEGLEAVYDQLIRMGEPYLQKYPEITRIGLASAGPLNPNTGELLDPTNLVTQGQGWGIVPLSHELGRRLNRPVILENDAAATILGEHWQGKAQKVDNCMVLTLGTGIGVGVICNGELVRSGRFLHPEAGHISLNIDDSEAPCGCGKNGCVEAYLSGTNFTARMARRWGEPDLTARELARRALEGEEKALEAFKEYARYFAAAIDCYVVLYAPELIVISGGFANTAEFFLDDVHPFLEKSLNRRRVGVDLYPQLVVSEHKTDIGLLGAAYVAFHR